MGTYDGHLYAMRMVIKEEGLAVEGGEINENIAAQSYSL